MTTQQITEQTKEWWIIFAQGPSFRRVDAEQLRGLGKTIGVNNAVFYCPWIDILYACDAKWWNAYGKYLGFFQGKRYSYQRVPDVQRFYRQKFFPTMGGNGGQQAIQLAVSQGAKKIALLGYDHKHTDGKKHCHRDHPRPLGNAGSVLNWPKVMDESAKVLKRLKVDVINLSRETAIECFPRVTVEDFVSNYRNL